MKNKILISSIILIVLLLGLSVISATDTNTTMTDSIEKQTIDFKTDNTKIDTKEIKASEKNTIRTKDFTLEKKETTIIKDNSKNEISTTDINKEIKTKTIKNTDNIEKQSKNLKSEDNTTIKTEEQTVTDFNSLKNTWNNTFTNGDNQTHYIINLKNGEYEFTENLVVGNTNVSHITFQGENKDKTILNGQKIHGIFFFNTTKINVYINNITFKNGYNAISSNSNLTVNNSKFIDNHKMSAGAAIYSYISDLRVYNCLFDNNNISTTIPWGNLQGGAIYKHDGNTLIINSIFTNNFVKGNFQAGGGAITVIGNNIRNATINNCLFQDNKVSSRQNNGYSNLVCYGNQKNISQCIFVNGEGILGNNNYFMENKLNDFNNTVALALNGKTNDTIITQYDTVTLSYILQGKYYDSPAEKFGVAPYKYPITTDNPLLNTSGLYLSPENNYTLTLDTSSLKDVIFDDINLYVAGIKAGTIKYKGTIIKQDNITAKPGEIINIISYFYDGKNPITNGKVAFKINSKTIGHSNVTLGQASLQYKIPNNYTAKNYTINVVYGGTNKYNPARMNATLKLNKVNTKTTITTNNTIANSTMQITVKTVDENNKPVIRGKITVKVNGKTITLTNTTGVKTVEFNIPKSWANRNITITALYGENSLYNQSRDKMKLTIEPMKMPLKTTNSIKKEDTIINYYVSQMGSDNNTGTMTNPFKTIAKAINQTTPDKTYNIYILNGTYKGVGNTNLTVPGNHKINFIGEGINNTILDGEVNYTVGGATVWGDSKVWNPYDNGTGNWFMNITKGNGLITITNFTMQHAWVYGVDGGDSISKYPTAPVDNYGNLEVNNMYFYYNCAGVGAGIRNNNGSTLLVNNSLFEKNRKSESTGNFGAGIYNNGTAVIVNSIFRNNFARWGTITNDRIMNITNCTLQNNSAYGGGSTFKYGSGIAVNSGAADFFNPYGLSGLQTNIRDCTFIGNRQTDIYSISSALNVTNNTFDNCTGIYIAHGTDKTRYANIINNTFNKVSPTDLFINLGSNTVYPALITASGSGNIVIESNNMKLANNDNKGYAIKITGSYNIINNNTIDRRVILEGNNNKVNNTKITTTADTYAIEIGNNKYNNISNNYLTSKTYVGVDSVDTIDNNYVLDNNNTPLSTLVKLNDTLYNRYFDNNGNYKTSFGDNVQIQIIGTLTNKNLIFNNVTNITIFQQQTNIKSYNITIDSANTTMNINKVTITNTNNKPVVILGSNNNIIQSNNFMTNGNYTIELTGKNNTIIKNTLIADILVGNECVKADNTTNTINNNKPTYKNIILTDDNYKQYFNENSTFVAPENMTDIHLLLKGNLYNKDFIFNTTLIIGNYTTATVYNGTFILQQSKKSTLENITIINTDNKNAIILNNSRDNSISYMNITTKTPSIIINSTYLQSTGLLYNNITTISPNKTYSIVLSNVTGYPRIQNNNITTIGSTNTSSLYISENLNYNQMQLGLYGNNIITKGNGNDTIIYSIYDKNTVAESLGYSSNIINTIGTQNAISIYMINNMINTSRVSRSVSSNTIKTIASNYTSNIVVKGSLSVRIDSNKLNTNSTSSINIDIENTNPTINKNILTTDSENVILIKIQNMNNSNIENNTLTITNKANGTPIVIHNSTYNLIKNNTIFSKTIYTMFIDKTSENNTIVYNTLVTSETYGDKSILTEGKNRVRDNNPTSFSTNYLLNDDTYYEFFNENGILRPEIKTGETIEMIGDLINKNMIINKPINFIQTYGTIYNGTITLTKEAQGTNITALTINNTNIAQTVIINTNNTNINISSIRITNDNITKTIAVQINGNNNKIATTTDIIIFSYNDVDSLVVNGDNNQIKFNRTTFGDSLSIIYYSDKKAQINVIILKGNNNTLTSTSTISVEVLDPITRKGILSNAIVVGTYIQGDNNYINIGNIYLKNEVKSFTGVKFENANYNTLNMSYVLYTRNSMSSGLFYGHLLIDSSYNLINNTRIDNYYTRNPNEYALFIFKSNNNTIENLNLRNMANYLDNSNGNILMYNKITTDDVYAITLTNTTYNNIIKHNTLNSANLQGDAAVGADNLNNTIEYNTPRENLQTNTNIILENSTIHAKVNDTITITAKVTDIKNNLLSEGNVTFKINNNVIGVVTVMDGKASINYTIPFSNITSYKITATYEDNDNYAMKTTTGTIIIDKTSTKLLVGNITNTGSMATLSAILMDGNGNLLDGVVEFRINNMTVGEVNITNKIALLTIDISKYDVGNYEITAIYEGNYYYNSTINTGILSINNYDVKQIINPITTKVCSTIKITSYIFTKENTPINTGKVIFKINGKTLKDEYGDIIYATINNGIASIDYELSSSIGAKNYTLTAVAMDKTYNRIETNTTLTLEKHNTQVILQPQYLNRSKNAIIKAKIIDEEGNLVIGTTKVAIKLNNKTITHAIAVNGILNATLDLSIYKQSLFNLTIVAGENKLYNSSKSTNALIIE